jgi:outer membrane protein assembly factor BamB
MVVVVLSIASMLSIALTPGADWPQWRGPGRDGVVQGVSLPDNWPKELKEQWKVEVGEGHASPVVVGDKVYLFSRENDDEVIRCLQLDSGKEVWKDHYEAPYEMAPAARGHGKGPKSTPTYSNVKLYTLGISGILSCIDAKTGKVDWRKEFSKEFKKTSPLFGTAMSPLLDKGLCIAHVGGHDQGALTAFDAKTGEIKWKNDFEGPGYTSPIFVTLAGEPQIVTQTQNHVVSVSPSTGKLLWKIPFKTPFVQNIVTPVVYKDLLIYSGFNQPVTAIRLEKKGDELAPTEVWSDKKHPMYMSSPVLSGKLLFGMTHQKNGAIFCLDAETGKPLWESDGRMGDNVALLNAGKALLLLTTSGKLLVVKPDDAKFEKIAEFTVSDSPTWAHPVFLENRVLIKDKTALRSLSLSE